MLRRRAKKQILEALQKIRSCSTAKSYVILRRIYADRFEKMFESEIKQAYGADHAEMTAFFNLHKDIKEEFYTAIDPQYDQGRARVIDSVQRSVQAVSQAV